jgi:hypothetical protein
VTWRRAFACLRLCLLTNVLALLVSHNVSVELNIHVWSYLNEFAPFSSSMFIFDVQNWFFKSQLQARSQARQYELRTLLTMCKHHELCSFNDWYSFCRLRCIAASSISGLNIDFLDSLDQHLSYFINRIQRIGFNITKVE